MDTIKVLASCLETATRLCDPKSIARVGWMLQEKGALLIVKTLLLPRERALNPKPKERDRERERESPCEGVARRPTRPEDFRALCVSGREA